MRGLLSQLRANFYILFSAACYCRKRKLFILSLFFMPTRKKKQKREEESFNFKASGMKWTLVKRNFPRRKMSSKSHSSFWRGRRRDEITSQPRLEIELGWRGWKRQRCATWKAFKNSDELKNNLHAKLLRVSGGGSDGLAQRHKS